MPTQRATIGRQVLLPLQRAWLEAANVAERNSGTSMLFTVPPSFDEEFLTALTSALYERHDALRLRARLRDTGPEAYSAPTSPTMLRSSVEVEQQESYDEESASRY